MKEDIVIRKVIKEDLPQIQKMYRDLIPDGVSMEVLERNFAAVEKDDTYFVLAAVQGGRVLGSTMGILCVALDAPFLVVENVIVDRDCRGKGIGRMIFEELDRIAIDNGCEYALLVSSGFRKEAHCFYEAMGYNDDVRGFRKYYDILI